MDVDLNLYLNKHYLLNAKREEIVSENAPLFSLQYYLLSDSDMMLESLRQYTHRMENKQHPGLYDQFPERHGNKDDYTSPDQLIAFVGALYLSKQIKKIKEIRKYLARHAFTYDNVRPGEINKDRLMQPAAIWFTAVASGRWWYRPALSGAIIYSCATKKGETSGKLKAWTMARTLRMKYTLKLCTRVLSGFNSWRDVFRTYYQEPAHPNRVLADKLR
ncbi:MAG: hypothetical protein Unbinned1322contig1000_48 [Prokaryotic dsDNA virus sp.]|nr:MAG: hypothetical protein Unbinned1322contig1000_48 [Prokaryotic dsDNA virus sp.]